MLWLCALLIGCCSLSLNIFVVFILELCRCRSSIAQSAGIEDHRDFFDGEPPAIVGYLPGPRVSSVVYSPRLGEEKYDESEINALESNVNEVTAEDIRSGRDSAHGRIYYFHPMASNATGLTHWF